MLNMAAIAKIQTPVVPVNTCYSIFVACMNYYAEHHGEDMLQHNAMHVNAAFLLGCASHFKEVSGRCLSKEQRLQVLGTYLVSKSYVSVENLDVWEDRIGEGDVRLNEVDVLMEMMEKGRKRCGKVKEQAQKSKKRVSVGIADALPGGL